MSPVRLLSLLLLVTACDDGRADDAAPSPDAAAPADAAAADTAVADTASPDATPPDAAAPDAAPAWACTAPDDDPPFLAQIGCFADFERLASPPLDSTLPGARALKTVVDRADGDALYFQNTNQYAIHWAFASAHLSGEGLPLVPMLAAFNATEYSALSRRFLLGSVTWYEGPGVWAYELAPYDSAPAELIETAFRRIADQAYFGADLVFHPTSEAVARAAEGLSPDIPVVDTDTLYAGIDYQPLNPAESVGRLAFVEPGALADTYLGARDIVVLRQAPNDITVVAGLITEAFQTPLSHVNVLSKNRGTPNMALRGAFDDADLRALEGQWVRLTVEPLQYRVEAVDQATADAWWEANKPPAVQVPGVDLTVTDLRDAEDIVDLAAPDLRQAIKAATRAFGGKAAHYGALRQIPDLPVSPAFGVPVFYYFQHLTQNGLDRRIESMLADPRFERDAAFRDAALDDLRDAIEDAPLDADLGAALAAKLTADFPGQRMRFRSSTNAEDLDGFTGAGLYTSKSAALDDPDDPVEDAIRQVWASVWSPRAFEERAYRSIDHGAVGMALLVHRSFPDEEANGVALTNNPFDPSGLEPAFYVNVQAGETSVVQPPEGVTTESFLYYFDRAGQPTTFISRSSLVPAGERVLTAAQTFALGQALDRVRRAFTPAYGQDAAWWAMDVEFKFDGEPGEPPALFIKQARPYQ